MTVLHLEKVYRFYRNRLNEQGIRDTSLPEHEEAQRKNVAEL